MVPVVLVLLGALVLLYPVGATYYNNYIQHQFARQYGAQVESMSASGLQAQLTAARQYNATLPAGLLQDPWDAKNPAMTAASSAYQAQLNAFDAMARIRIPAINVDLPIYHVTSEEVLARGIGHLFGSALPVGGSGTHAVLTGHSSLANATMFDHLPQLRMGDRFSIDVYGQTLAYQVDQITVVLPDQLDNIRRVNGADYVTLVTCTPYAVNTAAPRDDDPRMGPLGPLAPSPQGATSSRRARGGPRAAARQHAARPEARITVRPYDRPTTRPTQRRIR